MEWQDTLVGGGEVKAEKEIMLVPQSIHVEGT